MRPEDFDGSRLDFLDLPVGEVVELRFLTDPVYLPVHAYCLGRDGMRRNFACREPDDDCYWCAEGGSRPIPFGYATVKSGGEFFLFQMSRSLIKMVEARAGTRVVVQKVRGRPYFHILETGTEAIRIGDREREELAAVPQRLADALKSVGYLLEYGPLGAFDFVNCGDR